MYTYHSIIYIYIYIQPNIRSSWVSVYPINIPTIVKVLYIPLKYPQKPFGESIMFPIFWHYIHHHEFHHVLRISSWSYHVILGGL